MRVVKAKPDTSPIALKSGIPPLAAARPMIAVIPMPVSGKYQLLAAVSVVVLVPKLVAQMPPPVPYMICAELKGSMATVHAQLPILSPPKAIYGALVVLRVGG